MMDGIELSAKFFEACGREVSDAVPGYLGEWFVLNSSRSGWHKFNDLTQPGHLETVIGMVRERAGQPAMGIRFLEAVKYNLDPMWWWETNACEGLMRAASRAAGVLD